MRRILALGLVTLAVWPSAAAADVTDGSVALVDRPSGFGTLPFDGASLSQISTHSISANGCYVVFSSNNDVLLPNDDDAFANIYRQDRCAPGHPVTLVSTAPDGTPANGNSFRPSISASGRYVAFTTFAGNLDPAVLGNATTIVVKDMNTGAVEVANRADGANGAVAGQTDFAVISGDGRHVAFLVPGAFDAANVDGIAGDNNAYVRFLDTPARTYMASLTSGNARDGKVSFNSEVGISFDGSSVAFVTTNPLDPIADGDTASDAYLVRGYTGASPSVQLASYTVGNLTGSDSASIVALSSNGKYIGWANNRVWFTICDLSCGADGSADSTASIASTRFTSLSFANGPNATTAPTHLFWSNDRSLKPQDTNNDQDLYARDISPGGTAITLLTAGTETGGAIGGTATDDASALVVFESESLDLPGTDGADSQTFAIEGGQTTNISQPEGQPRRSEVATGIPGSIHSVSADGRFVAFASGAPVLGAQPLRGFLQFQAYVRDIVTGATTPVSFTSGGAPADLTVSTPSIDAAGDRVVFSTRATNLSPDATSGARDHVYLHDLRTGATTLLDRNPSSGAPLAQGGVLPQISADGTKVVFLSGTTEITPVSGSHLHVYEIDVATGKTTLVDKTQGGTPADDDATRVDVGGDRVAFLSSATNLGGNTAGGQDRDAYVKDLRTGVVFWASVPEDGGSGKSNAVDVSLSGDGSRVAFTNLKAGFGFAGDNLSHVFVRDVDAAKTTLASGGTGNVASLGQSGASLSADGKRVAFTESSPGLASAFVRDLAASDPTAVAPGARLGTQGATLNADGKCVVFVSRSPDIATPSFGPDYFHTYLRAMGGNCPAAQVQPPPGGGDKTPPVISKLRVTNKRFALAGKRTAAVARARKKVKRGTAFKFTLSEAARSRFTIALKAPGRLKGKRCVKPRKGLKKRCSRFLTVMTLTRAKTHLGANTVSFTGRVGKKKLKPGTYRATLVATDASGNRSRTARVTFAVVAG